MDENKEFDYSGYVVSGFAMLAVVLLLIPAVIVTLWLALPQPLIWLSAVSTAVGVLAMIILACGFFILQPNQARVMIFFGK